jgi:hypothetical protein
MGEVLLIQPGLPQSFVLRYVSSTGYSLRVRVRTGQVEFGKPTAYPASSLVGTGGGERDRYFMEIDFHPSYITWNFGVGGDNRSTGSYLYKREPPPPLQGEEDYRQAVRDGLNLAFRYAMLPTTK